MLTKSNYLSAHQCYKRLWLEKKSDLEKPDLTRSELQRIKEGNQVGELARVARGEGTLIQGLGWEGVIAATQAAIESGETRIFEAAFRFKDYAVRLDVIEKNASSWNILEVKASTSIKSEHIADISFQKHVAELAGLKIGECSILLLNKAYTTDGSKDLFANKNVDEQIAEYLLDLDCELGAINRVIKAELCPEVHVSSHCKKPDKCSYYELCWKNIPQQSIFSIPRLHKDKERELITEKAIAIIDLPFDFELSHNQRKYVDSVINGKTEIDRRGIREKLDELNYPIYFFDVESCQKAVPEISQVHPYDQICFQFSCHVLEESGAVRHYEFLQTDNSDPRLPFLEKLFQVIGATGSIVVYNQQFEIGRFRDLAVWFPEYRERLTKLIERVWDQMIIFKDYYMHPDFNGSISIKAVLPVLVPKLSYKDLAISRGDEASAIWNEMVQLDESEEKEKVIQALKEYCKLDTLAMVEIHRVLEGL